MDLTTNTPYTITQTTNALTTMTSTTSTSLAMGRTTVFFANDDSVIGTIGGGVALTVLVIAELILISSIVLVLVCRRKRNR